MTITFLERNKDRTQARSMILWIRKPGWMERSLNTAKPSLLRTQLGLQQVLISKTTTTTSLAPLLTKESRKSSLPSRKIGIAKAIVIFVFTSRYHEPVLPVQGQVLSILGKLRLSLQPTCQDLVKKTEKSLSENSQKPLKTACIS